MISKNIEIQMFNTETNMIQNSDKKNNILDDADIYSESNLSNILSERKTGNVIDNYLMPKILVSTMNNQLEQMDTININCENELRDTDDYFIKMCEQNLNEISNKYLVNKDLMSLVDKSGLGDSCYNNPVGLHLNTSMPEIDSSFTPFNPQMRHLNMALEDEVNGIQFVPNNGVNIATVGPAQQQ